MLLFCLEFLLKTNAKMCNILQALVWWNCVISDFVVDDKNDSNM